MGVLSDLLEKVAPLNPVEVVVATERPVVVVHPKRIENIDGLIRDRQVYEALVEILSPEQQADLAVGHRVDLEVPVGAQKWHVVAVTGIDVISIRALPADESREGLDVDEVIIIFPSEIWDGANEPEPRRAAEIAREVEFEIVLEFENDFDIDIVLEPEPARCDEEIEIVIEEEVEVPRRLRSAPNQIVHVSSGIRSWRDAQGLAISLNPGTLCFLHIGPDSGKFVAKALRGSALLIDEETTMESAHEQLALLGKEGLIVFEVEDPSPWLPWILRRTKEGKRVLIETRAWDLEAARRTLLGDETGPQAMSRLSGVRITSAVLREGVWRVVA